MAYCTTDMDVSAGSAMRVIRTKTPIYGLDEIADYAKLSKNTIRKLVKESNFPAGKVGGKWCSYIESIDSWRTSQINNGNAIF